MARPLRIEYPNAWYHVTSRGNERSPLFRDDFDRRVFIKILRESLEAFQVELHCFVLMLTHYHFLLKTPLANLSRLMQRFNTAYTVYFNKRHDRPGHLFQGRFKAILIDADSYLMELSRYIHLNPVRTEQFKDTSIEEKIKFLESYRWSSFLHYIGKDKKYDFIRTDAVLGLFGASVREARRRYREFVLEGLTMKLSSPLRESEKQLVLGPPAFVEWVYSTFIEGREADREYSRRQTSPPDIPADEIVKAVSDEFGIPSQKIVKSRSHCGIARQMAIELRCRFGMKSSSLGDIGREFGGISVSGIGKSRVRLAAGLEKDARLARRFEKIRSGLISLKRRSDPQ